MSIIAYNWIKWFDSRESVDFVNKVAQEELFASFNASIEEDDCNKKLIDHQEVLFLSRETFSDKIHPYDGGKSSCIRDKLKEVSRSRLLKQMTTKN